MRGGASGQSQQNVQRPWGGSDSKESAFSAGNPGLILGSGRTPGEGHGNPLRNPLLWRIPWTEEPGGLQPMGSQRLRQD